MGFRSGGVEKRAASPTVINPIIESYNILFYYRKSIY